MDQEFTNGPCVRQALEKKYSPLVSKIQNIPPWSYLDAAAAGPASATSAAASAVCIYYVVIGGRYAPPYKQQHRDKTRGDYCAVKKVFCTNYVWKR